MSHIVWSMIRSGEISGKQLVVYFIDEEGLYPSMVENAERWRKKFMDIGVPFIWYCLPFKQVCVIDGLSASESWITWEPGKEDVWMRKMPEYAVCKHPLMEYAGQWNYKNFCERAFSDGVQMIGLRISESLTRLKEMAHCNMDCRNGKFYPIYDWRDSDIWLYIKEHNLPFPEIYMRLYEAGQDKRQLRLCAFFGDCGTQGLRWIAETDPVLWEKIEKRMPNAYLVLLYWDSEMFRRNTEKRRELEADEEERDYKDLVGQLLRNPQKFNVPSDTIKNLRDWRKLYMKAYGIASNKQFKDMYEALLYGDPKNRMLRISYIDIFNSYQQEAKKNG